MTPTSRPVLVAALGCGAVAAALAWGPLFTPAPSSEAASTLPSRAPLAQEHRPISNPTRTAAARTWGGRLRFELGGPQGAVSATELPAPPASSSGPAPDLVGIVSGGGGRTAYFAQGSEAPVSARAGAQVGGWRVAAITRDTVVLESGSTRTEQRLFQPDTPSSHPSVPVASPAPAAVPLLPAAPELPKAPSLRPNPTGPQAVRPPSPAS